MNQRSWVTDNALSNKSFTIMLLISVVENKEKFFHLNFENNTGRNVLMFIADAVRSGYLERDDYLILDNAPVHWELESLLVCLPVLLLFDLGIYFASSFLCLNSV